MERHARWCAFKDVVLRQSIDIALGFSPGPLHRAHPVSLGNFTLFFPASTWIILESQGGKWEEVYEEVAAREMEILETLTNGQALEEHMEDFYLEVSRGV